MMDKLEIDPSRICKKAPGSKEQGPYVSAKPFYMTFAYWATFQGKSKTNAVTVALL